MPIGVPVSRHQWSAHEPVERRQREAQTVQHLRFSTSRPPKRASTQEPQERSSHPNALGYICPLVQVLRRQSTGSSPGSAEQQMGDEETCDGAGQCACDGDDGDYDGARNSDSGPGPRHVASIADATPSAAGPTRRIASRLNENTVAVALARTRAALSDSCQLAFFTVNDRTGA